MCSNKCAGVCTYLTVELSIKQLVHHNMHVLVHCPCNAMHMYNMHAASQASQLWLQANAQSL